MEWILLGLLNVKVSWGWNEFEKLVYLRELGMDLFTIRLIKERLLRLRCLIKRNERRGRKLEVI